MSGEKVRVLAVDDDETFLEDLASLMSEDYVLKCARSGEEALAALERGAFDAVLLDLNLRYANEGFEVLGKILELDPNLPVIMVTRDSSAASAVAALKKGAVDYIDKTPDLADLERRICHALAEQRQKLVEQNRFLRQEIDTLKGEMIGEASAMRRLGEAIAAAAGAASPVLIVGETGTGKELVARALYRLSRGKGLFVAVNCAAIPRTLFEGTLFGAERGAYTGAERPIEGAFETAAHGLLFLDEITEIDPSMQAALLRVIETREFRPLGGGKTKEFTGRVVASTNRDLAGALKEGVLRQDLYYRLSAYVVEVPPLRERREDIPRLVEYFLGRKAAELKRPRPVMEPELMARLCSYQWPGNVRELQNVIERFVASGHPVPPGRDLAGSREDSAGEDDLVALPYEEAKALVVRRFQEKYLNAIISAHGGNVSAAAERMGLSRYGLQKLLKQLEGSEESAGD